MSQAPPQFQLLALASMFRLHFGASNMPPKLRLQQATHTVSVTTKTVQLIQPHALPRNTSSSPSLCCFLPSFASSPCSPSLWSPGSQLSFLSSLPTACYFLHCSSLGCVQSRICVRPRVPLPGLSAGEPGGSPRRLRGSHAHHLGPWGSHAAHSSISACSQHSSLSLI